MEVIFFFDNYRPSLNAFQLTSISTACLICQPHASYASAWSYKNSSSSSSSSGGGVPLTVTYFFFSLAVNHWETLPLLYFSQYSALYSIAFRDPLTYWFRKWMCFYTISTSAFLLLLCVVNWKTFFLFKILFLIFCSSWIKMHNKSAYFEYLNLYSFIQC